MPSNMLLVNVPLLSSSCNSRDATKKTIQKKSASKTRVADIPPRPIYIYINMYIFEILCLQYIDIHISICIYSR